MTTRLRSFDAGRRHRSALSRAGSGGRSLEPYPVKGKVLQRLNAFDEEVRSFSADGSYVFVSNSAELGMRTKAFIGPTKGQLHQQARCTVRRYLEEDGQ
jgi:hypothetical protein